MRKIVDKIVDQDQLFAQITQKSCDQTKGSETTEESV